MHENEFVTPRINAGCYPATGLRPVSGRRPGQVKAKMATSKNSKQRRSEARRAVAREDSIYEMQVRICKALGNSTRLRILDLLGKQAYTVSGLQKELGIPLANVSVQLAILRTAGVVSTQKKGKEVHCSLALPEVRQACHFIRQVLRAQVRNTKRIAI